MEARRAPLRYNKQVSGNLARKARMNSLHRYARYAARRILFPAVIAALFFVSLGAAGISPVRAADVGKTENLYLPTALVRPFRGSDPRRLVVVCTPAGYGDPANSARRYPVVFLLHGSPGHPFNFLHYGHFPERMEDAVRAGQMQPVIFVIPDGNYVGQKNGDSEWADSADRKDRFETWIVKELVPYMDTHYRTRAEAAGRFLGGVSEGGFGSVNLALRNPRVFGGAVGLSGYYDMRHFGWGHFIFNDSDALMSLNSPLYYVPERTASGRIPPEWKNLHLFLGAGAAENPYADHTRRLGDALRAAGVRDVTVDTAKGKHDWNLWTTLFFQAISAFLPASGTRG